MPKWISYWHNKRTRWGARKTRDKHTFSFNTHTVNSSSHSGLAVRRWMSVFRLPPFCPSTVTSQYGLHAGGEMEAGREGLVKSVYTHTAMAIVSIETLVCNFYNTLQLPNKSLLVAQQHQESTGHNTHITQPPPPPPPTHTQQLVVIKSHDCYSAHTHTCRLQPSGTHKISFRFPPAWHQPLWRMREPIQMISLHSSPPPPTISPIILKP